MATIDDGRARLVAGQAERLRNDARKASELLRLGQIEEARELLEIKAGKRALISLGKFVANSPRNASLPLGTVVGVAVFRSGDVLPGMQRCQQADTDAPISGNPSSRQGSPSMRSYSDLRP